MFIFNGFYRSPSKNKLDNKYDISKVIKTEPRKNDHSDFINSI